MALKQPPESGDMIKSIICELINKDVTNILPIKCYIDSRSLLDLVYSTKTITEKKVLN